MSRCFACNRHPDRSGNGGGVMRYQLFKSFSCGMHYISQRMAGCCIDFQAMPAKHIDNEPFDLVNPRFIRCNKYCAARSGLADMAALQIARKHHG